MKRIDRTLTDEQLFEIQLTALAKFFELENPNFNPVICGRRVQLFQLGQIVRGIGSDVLDWIKRKQKLLHLGFRWCTL